MSNFKEPKQTQGNKKLVRYFSDLVRNANFIRALKQLNKLSAAEARTGYYKDWTPEQQKEHDAANEEIPRIIKDYERVKRRCRKLDSKAFKKRMEIAQEYGLDLYMLQMVEAMFAGNQKDVQFTELMHGPMELCCLNNRHYEQLYEDQGHDLMWLWGDRRVELVAFPISISINVNASKRDVLDYIEKNWQRIEAMLSESREKPLRIKKRKYSQDLIDFVYDNQAIKSKDLVKMLDEKFPKHGLAYFEISKLISEERKRRNRDLSNYA